MKPSISAQAGQAMTEFIIVFPVLMLLIFGGLQFAFIYHAKTTLNYATFEAARAGALNNARMNFIQNAFARGMAPLYTHEDRVRMVQAARERVRWEINQGFVQFELLNPVFPDSFTDHGIPVDGGGVEIPNDNLRYRPPTIGGLTGTSIQDANLLKLRITYCYPLYVPFINRTIVTLMTQPAVANPANWVQRTAPSQAGTEGLGAPTDPFHTACLNNNRLPIVAQSIVRMHSPAFCETC